MAYDILLRNVMNDIFAVGKYVGRALPLNYIERSRKAVRLPFPLSKTKISSIRKNGFHPDIIRISPTRSVDFINLTVIDR